METKKELRNKYLQIRNEMSYEQVLAKSRQIVAHLLLYKPLTYARTVMTYMPKGNEADLVALSLQMWESDMKVLIPACTDKYGSMEAAVLKQEELFALKQDDFGIWVPENPEFTAPEAIDVLLVPGLAFDKQGYRLGFGGGYYDRYLNRVRTNAFTIGIGFDCQLTEALPREAFDKKLCALCTESGIIEIADK
ncbi:MAG: 5-formyltetrahydrofolate cyclo-ligase [Clostridia bacterium]|nr:5-formyltetrahydrofolate cyclo-ligase [Clostridia bacterium]